MLKKLMQLVKDYLVEDMTEVSYETWIKDLKIVDVKDGVYLLGVDQAFKKVILEDRYKGLIEEAFSFVEESEVEVQFVYKKNEGKKKKKKKKLKGKRIERFAFGNFVVGDSNRLAHDVLKMIIESDETKYNPIVIYGPNGTGKTHLLQAVQNDQLLKGQENQAFYYSIKTFENTIISAAKKSQSMDVQEFFRNFDILLLDDFQFCNSKPWIQESIYHLLNDRILAEKQVVIAIDRKVNEIGLENWLKCRLKQGLILEITTPEDETMFAILKNMAEKMGLFFTNEVSRYLVENFGANIMMLEGSVKKLEFVSSFLKREISVSFCKEILNKNE